MTSAPILPPPLPKAPFAQAKEVETLPGLFSSAEVMQLRRSLQRVREERDDALRRLRAMAQTLPPRTRRQAILRGTVSTAKWITVGLLIGFAALSPELARAWTALMRALGWL